MTAGTDVVTYSDTNIFGSTVRMTRRTAAHLDWTKAELAKAHAGATIKIIQGAYNTSVSASAGTHDLGACLDVYIPGWAYSDMQAFLRAHGWAAWWRYPPSFSSHIHMISLGYTGPVGIYVPGQVSDYYNHRTGLVGHYSDSSWHPADIAATVFDYAAHLHTVTALKEDDMPTAKDLLDADLSPHATVREALLAALDTQRALSAMRDNIRERDVALANDINNVMVASHDDATKADLARVHAKLVAEFGTKDTAPPAKR